MSTEELLALRDKYDTEASQFDARQMAVKIMINSAYGAIGNQHFRYYNYNEATAITISGQVCLKWIDRHLNAYMNKLCGTEGKDYVIYGDTDSLYVNFGPIVEKFAADKDLTAKVDFIQKAAETKFQELIAQYYEELADRTNVFENHFDMKRENIGPGVFVSKKRYVMEVYDSEGVRYAKPKMKVMGLESVRSTTPEFFRNEITNTMKMLFNNTESEVIDYIEDIRQRFNQLDPYDIGSPTGVNNLEKYACESGFNSGTPAHVKGAMVYNRLIEAKGLQSQYQPIKEGEKVKVVPLKIPNPCHNSTIAFPNSLPSEFGIAKYVDYDAQFEKMYLEPMKRILDVMGWKTEHSVSLEDFFG